MGQLSLIIPLQVPQHGVAYPSAAKAQLAQRRNAAVLSPQFLTSYFLAFQLFGFFLDCALNWWYFQRAHYHNPKTVMFLNSDGQPTDHWQVESSAPCMHCLPLDIFGYHVLFHTFTVFVQKLYPSSLHPVQRGIFSLNVCLFHVTIVTLCPTL